MYLDTQALKSLSIGLLQVCHANGFRIDFTVEAVRAVNPGRFWSLQRVRGHSRGLGFRV